tara:strand:- start:1044 stop:4025 length:2982 start_codon:yes stop_codon:yes gene_type:complete
MSVKSFKFVSPGVFIHEIDNSFIPKSAQEIGPVVIGRAGRGIANEPVKVESYSEFVQMFGDTVPGGAGGDVYRNGNFQSPMYGTYAAKAFLRSNVAPLTYVRLLGVQSGDRDTSAAGSGAGWQTDKQTQAAFTPGLMGNNGGAFGLFVFPSSSNVAALGNGTLGAIWYVDHSASIALSGTLPSADPLIPSPMTAVGGGVVCQTEAISGENLFTAVLSSSLNGNKKYQFGFNDTSENFIRKVFSTNPQLSTDAGTFYGSSAVKEYWLGESFEQNLRRPTGSTPLIGNGTSLVGAASFGVILPLQASWEQNNGPAYMYATDTREARTGWFIGQDLGAAASYTPDDAANLFRLIGRGHGEWINKNVKVSIEKIKASNSPVSDFGTFSVVLRRLNDTDNRVVVLERFDNCNLNPASPNYVGRKIGDEYLSWNSTERRLRKYGEYPNKSKFVRVDVSQDVEEGASDATLLPFGYRAAPKFNNLVNWCGQGATLGVGDSRYIWSTASYFMGGASQLTNKLSSSNTNLLSASAYGTLLGVDNAYTASILFPQAVLRNSASDGGLADPTNAYFGVSNTRTATSTISDPSVQAMNRAWTAGWPTDNTAATGIQASAYVFSMDDICKNATDSGYYFRSGSRATAKSETGKPSQTYKTLLNAGYDRFTAPMWGGFDGFDIHKPDPLYNNGITATTERTNYIYNTIKRGIDICADPEFIDVNLMAIPGLTKDELTTHAINVCDERADCLALVDLSNVYIPKAEQWYSTKSERQPYNPTQVANALTDRLLDSSYGCTFYPWVQTRDEGTGQLLWIPPSVAMMGVLASSQAKSDVWFAPAGFNRGGLTDGAAGIPIVNVSERVISKDRDTLYEARINPIASFPSSGIVVFGQKTLQARQSALDRINVRRLVIYLKKQISILSTQVLFEQNVQATWNRFKSLIEPFLANVKTQFGITEYRLILDESTTTPDLIDQNIMYAKIMIKPARAIEYIAIDFVIASTGASFDD